MYGEDLDLALRLRLAARRRASCRPRACEHDYEFDEGRLQVVPARAQPLVDDARRLPGRLLAAARCRRCSRPSSRCSWSPRAAAGWGRSCARRRPCCASCRRSWPAAPRAGRQGRRGGRAGAAPVGEPRQSLSRPARAALARWRCSSAPTGELSRPASRPAGGWARAPERGRGGRLRHRRRGRGHPRARGRARAEAAPPGRERRRARARARARPAPDRPQQRRRSTPASTTRPGSLKARLCVEGARELYAYCEEHGIPFETRGKLIVARDESELARLDELERRGRENEVPGLRRRGRRRAARDRAACRGVAALHSPDTGVVDFAEVARALAAELERGGAVGGLRGRRHRARDGRVRLVHSRGETRARFAVFCAGRGPTGWPWRPAPTRTRASSRSAAPT